MKRKPKFAKIGALSYAKLLSYMMSGTLNCNELAEATGLHVLTVYQYTRAMHKEGVTHVCDWETDRMGRETIRIYMLGKGKDAARRTKTRAQIAEDYRTRQRMKQMLAATAGATA